MLGSLLKAGIEITNSTDEADAVIVNTCSFIDAAQEESVDAILEATAVRDAQRRDQAVIVSGCLSQRFREELPKLLPEVDAFIGIDQVARIPMIVRDALARRSNANQPPALPTRPSRSAVKSRIKEFESKLAKGEAPRPIEKTSIVEPLIEINSRPTYIPDVSTPRFRLTPRHTAYLKIAEGCNHPCSFCIIPRMRGSHRSRRQDDIVADARKLIADGVKELNLISQDSTYYGLDLRAERRGSISSPEKFAAVANTLPAGATTLCTLLRELDSIPGDFWIRLLYTHPAHWTDELIRTIAECPKVARYVDMPLQHIHDNMLERMRRETSRQHIVDLIGRIRGGIPGITLRTTFIVGFPGETDDCFDALLEFIRDTRFERAGVFSYSREEGTRAASMAGQLPDRVKKSRLKRAMATQQKVARSIARSFVGRTIKVLVENRAARPEPGGSQITREHGALPHDRGSVTAISRSSFVARGEADAPDIDGRVYVRGHLPLGEFASVRVVDHTDYDLIAEPA